MSTTKSSRRKWRAWLADAKAGRLRITRKKTSGRPAKHTKTQDRTE